MKTDASIHLSSALHLPQFWHLTHCACEGAFRLPRVDMEGASFDLAFSAHLQPTSRNDTPIDPSVGRPRHGRAEVARFDSGASTQSRLVGDDFDLRERARSPSQIHQRLDNMTICAPQGSICFGPTLPEAENFEGS